MVCAACGSENREGRKFCSRCGALLAQACPACGAANEPDDSFCGECGTSLDPEPPRVASPAPRPEAPASERRLVSVLFADLVGFTSLSESRDAEEVRELLSRYFDACRRLIGLYGGTVEKFIGDAVMAVWGTPTATEDDAERAVRAALDLVAGVSALGDEMGTSELRARVGVLTGEAAVTLDAEGQGMVAGDLVNTASRVQSVAEPGSVLVGEATRRATEQTIVYETAGSFELKGKEEPTQLWRAVRVASGRAGALRSSGVEPPFVGRERELRLVKELFHATADQRKAHLVSVSGIAGIGKSRLAWEFFKYLDGVAHLVYWQRGRCLAYGEGVAYWALAEMMRMRAGIAEGEHPASARDKLRSTLADHVPDEEERSWVEPRLANLLGLEERTDADRQDLFAAWRLFFERLAAEHPVVLVFEDMQWADAALLAFVEYLLEWSGNHPLYVLSLARPELADRSPDFGRGVRNATTLALEPLPDGPMQELLDGFVPGLPDELRTRILERAQGVPLYAVETVRMLLDRGLLVQEEASYRPTGPIDALEVPETLHALIAARLDGLEPVERRLLQDACVLGKTFSMQALAAVSGESEAELEPMLAALVRKEVLSRQADPRSPERGQYGFLQDLLREVAYDTLSKRDRKARHIAASAFLETSFAGGEHEIAEVVASHYLAAYETAPDAPDAAEIREKAQKALSLAGERAASLAAPEEGQRYFEQAAALAEGTVAEAALLEQSGRLALQANRTDQARTLLERALAVYEQAGDARGAAHASAALADADVVEGRTTEAITRLDDAIPTLEQAGPSAELASALAQIGRMHALRGDDQRAGPPLERALALAEQLVLGEVFVEALTSKAVALMHRDRLEEARILLEAARAKALAEQLDRSALRAGWNLIINLGTSDRIADALRLQAESLALARRRGDRRVEDDLLRTAIPALVGLSRWDEALEQAAEVGAGTAAEYAGTSQLFLTVIHCARGELADARAVLTEWEAFRESARVDIRSTFLAFEAHVLRAEGRHEEALAGAEAVFAAEGEVGRTNYSSKLAWSEAVEAVLALGRLDEAEALVAAVEERQPGERTPMLEAQAARLRARLGAARGRTDGVDERFRFAALRFRELEHAFDLAVALLEHGEWLVAQNVDGEGGPLLAEAREIFEQLSARPWLERTRAVASAARDAVPA